jgi:membrane protease YdiL (CAAX protease family)
MKEIFFNEFDRLRSGWRFAVFCAVYVVLYIIANLFLTVFAHNLTGSAKAFFASPAGFIAGSLLALMIATGLGWLCGSLLEGLPPKALGWVFNRTWLKDYLWGLLLGILTITLAVGLAMPTGGISFIRNATSDTNAILLTIFSSFIVFFVAAAFEEALFRGYILQTFVRADLAFFAILLTSLPFALVHLNNPNATWFSTINTALAGIWFGLAYLKTRSLWLAFGLHLAWNWFQGAIYGINVSGISQIAPDPLLRAVDQGPTWLTGGHYGIEGGLTCTIALLVSTAVIWFLPVLQPTEEMLALTSRENAKRGKPAIDF